MSTHQSAPPPSGPSQGLPVRSALDASGLHLAFADIPPTELQDPFLHETVQRLPRPLSIVHTPTEQLGDVGPDAAPAGLIFHVARCGSTLVSQMLKQHRDLVVYAEPLAVNELLMPPHTGSRAHRVAALRTLGARFAAHAGRRYVLKLSSWNTLFCDLVAEAFPQTPIALCVRDPLEVAVSLQQSVPGWLRDDHAPRFLGTVPLVQQARQLDERIAHFLASFFAAGATHLAMPRTLLVPYATLPGSVIDRLAPHFGLALDGDVRQRMAASTQRHAKSGTGQDGRFVPDTELKRAAASAPLRRAIDEWAQPSYRALLDRFSGNER